MLFLSKYNIQYIIDNTNIQVFSEPVLDNVVNEKKSAK